MPNEKQTPFRWSKYAWKPRDAGTYPEGEIHKLGYIEQALEIHKDPHSYKDNDLLKAARILSSQSHLSSDLAKSCAAVVEERKANADRDHVKLD